MSFVEMYVWWQGFGFNNVASYEGGLNLKFQPLIVFDFL